MKKTAILIIALWISMFHTSSAHAYLDPGSGSILLQILLGGLAGLAVMMKVFWHRILAFLRISRNEDIGQKDSKDS